MPEANNLQAAANLPAKPLTMRVRLVSPLVGPNVHHKHGEIVEFPLAEAQRHIKSGNAVELSEEDEAVEAAVAEARAKARAKGSKPAVTR